MVDSRKCLVGVVGGNSFGFAVTLDLVEQGFFVVVVDPSVLDPQDIIDPSIGNFMFNTVHSAFEHGLLEITNDLSKLNQATLIFDCVGIEDCSLRKNAEVILPHLQENSCYIIKNTVPVGTGDSLQEWFDQRDKKIEVISYPELYREETAPVPINQPSYIVLGGDVLHPGIHSLRRLLYRDSLPIIMTSRKEAEMIKLAVSTFIATKLSFVNQMASLCEAMGIDIVTVARTIGIDPGIGQAYLQPGIGVVEPYLKEVELTMEQANRKGVLTPLLDAVLKVDQNQKNWVITKLTRKYPIVKGKKIAVWGGNMIGVEGILQQLAAQCTEIKLHYITQLDNTIEQMAWFSNHMDAVEDTQALIILSNLREYIESDLDFIKQKMITPFIVDAMSLFPPEMMEDRGFEYISVGRKV
ncbi:MAG TPA: hypothetical protein VJ824_05760 [Bacillota bacterium]|nr:hypothetical protein [Bacillota bacterium]